MTGTPVPHPKSVRDLLTDLLGSRQGRAGHADRDPVSIGPKEPGSVAIYTAERLSTGALAVADLPLSAFIGAALGLVPVGAAKDALAARKLPDNLAENLYEVVNVMASLFHVANAPHFKLYSLLAPGDPIPTDVAAMPSGLARRIDLAVKVPGYGDGKLALVVPG